MRDQFFSGLSVRAKRCADYAAKFARRRAKGDVAILKAVAEELERRLILTVTWAAVTPPTESMVAGAQLVIGLAATSDDNSLSGSNIAWGDGGNDTLDGTPSSASHVFAAPGVYTVAATFYDDATPGAPELAPSGSGYTVYQTLTVGLPTPDLHTSDSITMQAGQTFTSATVGAIDGYFGSSADYAGSLSVGASMYMLSFADDGSGNLLIQASGTAPTSAGDYVASVYVTDTNSGNQTNASGYLTGNVNPAAFTVTATNLTVAANSSLTSPAGYISGFLGSAADYSGTLSLSGNAYALNFTSDGSGNLQIDCTAYSLGSGSYPASLHITDTVDGLSTSASASFNILALNPLSAIGASTSSATLNVPWSGTIATVADDTSLGDSVSASTVYTNGSATFTTSPRVTGGGGSWTVSDSNVVFTAGGNFDARTTISDSAGRSATADSFVNVTLSSYSINAGTPSLLEGQAQDDVVVGTLSDGASGYSVASDFDGTFAFGTGIYYPVTLVPDSPNDGNYSLTVNFPALATGASTGSLDVTETQGGQVDNASVIVPVNVSSYNTLSATEQDASIQYRQTGQAVIASYSDSFGVNSSYYDGDLTIEGQSYSLLFSGGEVEASDLSALTPGTHTGTLAISDASVGESTCNVSVNVADGPISFGMPFTIDATMDVPWTGTIATFTDPDTNTLASDFTSNAGTITGSDGSFTVTNTLTFTALTGNAPPTVTVTGPDSTTYTSPGTSTNVTAAPIVLSNMPDLNVTADEPYTGTIANLYDFYETGDYNLSLSIAGSSGNAVTLGAALSSGVFAVQGSIAGLPAGEHTATLTAYQNNGAFGSTQTAATFNVNASPATGLHVFPMTFTAQLGPWSGAVATFTESDTALSASDYSATITWDDGSTSVGTVAVDQLGNGTVSAPGLGSAPHSFGAAGTFAESITVSDDQGNSGTASSTAIVALPSLVSVTATETGTSNTVTFTASPTAPEVLYYTRQAGGDASVIVTSIAAPDVAASYTYTQYRLIVSANGSDVADGPLTRDYNFISLPQLTGRTDDQFILECGILANGNFAPEIYATLAAIAPAVEAITPSQMEGAYGLGQYTTDGAGWNIKFGSVLGEGAGQTIGIVDAFHDPNALSDLNHFSTYFGLPTFDTVNGGLSFVQHGVTMNGINGPLPPIDPTGQWEFEESLDIEWAHAMAPLADIEVLETDYGNSIYGDLYAPDVTGLTVVLDEVPEDEFTASSPYNYSSTLPYQTESGLDSAVFAAAGVTYLAPSGDWGVYGLGGNIINALYPATSPDVLSVGGTTLAVGAYGAGNTYGSETSWGSGESSGDSPDGYYGSGGGISVIEPQAAGQSAVVSAFSTTNRVYPDLSIDSAAPAAHYDSFDDPGTPWTLATGTSLSGPLMAGIIALADEGRHVYGLGALTGATQTIPAIYSLPASDFHDIDSGNAIGPSSDPNTAPLPGYDLTSGRGSPYANLLIAALATYGSTLSTVQDPGFESPSTLGGSSPWGAGENASITDAAHSGTSALQLVPTIATGSQPGFAEDSQIVEGLVPDTTYVLTAYAEEPTGSVAGGAQITVSGFGGEQINVGTSSTTYQELTITFTTGNTDTSVAVGTYIGPDSGTAVANFDDFSIVPISSAENFGFETGSLAPWTSSPGNATVVTGPAANVSSGSYALQLDATSGAAGVYQTISNLLPDATYKVQGYAELTSGTGLAQIFAANYGGNEINVGTGEGLYSPLTITFTTGDGVTSVRIGAYVAAGAGKAIFDDFNIQQLSSIANLGFESGTLGSWVNFTGSYTYNPLGSAGLGSVVASPAETGGYALDLDSEAGSAAAGVMETIQGLQPSTIYTLYGYAEISIGSSSAAQIYVSGYGGAQINASTTSSSYAPITITFMTGSASTSAVIGMFTNPGAGDARYDGFSLQQQPSAYNFGFESGVLGTWSVGSGSATVVNTNAHTGVYSLLVDTAPGEATVSQTTLNLQADTTYTLTGYAAVNGNGPAYVFVSGYGGAMVFSAGATLSSYTLLTLTFRTGDSNMSAQLGVYMAGSGGTANYDDFSIVPS